MDELIHLGTLVKIVDDDDDGMCLNGHQVVKTNPYTNMG